MKFKNITLIIITLALSTPAFGMFDKFKRITKIIQKPAGETAKPESKKPTEAVEYKSAINTETTRTREEAANMLKTIETLNIHNIVENVHEKDSKHITACTVCKKPLEDSQVIAIAQPCGHVVGHLECARLYITMTEDRSGIHNCTQCKKSMESYSMYKITSEYTKIALRILASKNIKIASPDFKKPACEFYFNVNKVKKSIPVKARVLKLVTATAYFGMAGLMVYNCSQKPINTEKCIAGLHYCASYAQNSCAHVVQNVTALLPEQNVMLGLLRNATSYILGYR